MKHITGKDLFLSNFQKGIKEVITSANKNQMADIKIDGRGDLKIKSKSRKTIELKNVLVIGNITNNLISLRKFVDIGLSIKMDKEKIRVFDSVNNEDYIIGDYIKPNWIITFQIQIENPEDEDYSCTARLVSLDKYIEQSQTKSQDLTTSEGATSEFRREDEFVIDRENEDKFIQQNNNTEDLFIDSDLDYKMFNRKIHELS